MPAAAQNVPSGLQQEVNFSILLVSPHSSDETELREILKSQASNLRRESSVAAARAHLGACNLILCERDLPDGTWRELLQQCDELANSPLLMVISRHADESLWAEVLNLGGYDVLLKPFDPSEVSRTVGTGSLRMLRRSVTSVAAPTLATRLA